MYYQKESMEKFWKSRVKSVNEGNRMITSRAKHYKKDHSEVYELLLSDTGSVRGIMVKFIHRCGTQYMLKAVIDTTRGLSGYAKTFFESFSPKDTCIGIDVTSNKLDEYFFSKLFSADSSESKRAKGALEYVQRNMLPANVPALIRTINHTKGFNSLTPAEKSNLIACFGDVKSKESLPFLEELYERYSDPVEIQIAILKTLSKLKTEEAAKSFLRLIKEDVPISSSDYTLSQIFGNFSDSLEVARYLFPEILRYTKYLEYGSSIYELMAEVREKKLLKPKNYAAYVDAILLDANYELKKYRSEKKRDKEWRYYSYASYGKGKRPYDDLNSRQQNLYNYICLLTPFYGNKQVEKFFSKLLAASTSEKFKAVAYGFLVSNDAKLPHSVLVRCSSSLRGKAMFYRVLQTQNKLERFDKKYLVQKDMVIAQIFGSEEDFEKDTFALMTVRKAEIRSKSSCLYVIKYRPGDKKLWKMSYSGMHPCDSAVMNFSPQYVKTNVAFETEAQANKEIENLLRKIRMEGRRRGSASDLETATDGGSSYDYFYDNDY